MLAVTKMTTPRTTTACVSGASGEGEIEGAEELECEPPLLLDELDVSEGEEGPEDGEPEGVAVAAVDVGVGVGESVAEVIAEPTTLIVSSFLVCVNAT